MSIKIISGGPKQQEIKAEPEELSLGQTIGGQFARPAAALIENVAGLPGNITQFVQNKFMPEFAGNLERLGIQQLPNSQDIRKHTEKGAEALGLKKEQLKPTNVVEELIDWTAADLPLIFATGGAALPASIGTGIGVIGAKKAGLGGIGQFVGGLIGGSAANIVHKAGTGLGPIRKLAQHEKKKLYEQAEKIAPTLNQDAKTLRKDIDGLIKEAAGPASGLSSSEQKEVLHQLDNIYENIRGNTINVRDAWKQDKHLGQIIKKAGSQGAQYFKRASTSLKDSVLRPAAQAHPEFGEAYTKANQLHVALEVPNALRSALEGHKSLEKYLKTPLAKAIKSLLGLGGLLYPSQAIKTYAGYRTGRGILRAIDFYKTPIGRQIFSEIAKEAVEQNIPALKNTFIKLNAATEEFEKENPEKPQKKARFTVISGGPKAIA